MQTSTGVYTCLFLSICSFFAIFDIDLRVLGEHFHLDLPMICVSPNVSVDFWLVRLKVFKITVEFPTQQGINRKENRVQPTVCTWKLFGVTFVFCDVAPSPVISYFWQASSETVGL